MSQRAGGVVPEAPTCVCGHRRNSHADNDGRLCCECEGCVGYVPVTALGPLVCPTCGESDGCVSND